MMECYGGIEKMEQSNIKTKSIAQELEDIANDFCRNYCKWPDEWDEIKEGCELSALCRLM